MSKNVKTVLTVIIVLGLMFLIALPKLNFDKEDTLAASATEQVQSGIPVEVIKTAPLEMNNTINVTGSILANESVELTRSEEHTSELQSRENLVCRLLLEKKKRLSKTSNSDNE